MRRPALLATCLAVLIFHTGWGCPFEGPLVAILEPFGRVDSFSFDVRVAVLGDFSEGSLEVTLNGESILGQLAGGPLYTGQIQPGPPLQDHNLLEVRVQLEEDGRWITRQRHFLYLPPGKASAQRIERPHQLIRGPLAHNRLGDWMLQNGEARFAIQDVGQRELYSVGQYGGNIIDAEVRGNQGLDNFLELQPGLNLETVINAQSVEVVNDGQDGTAAKLRTCGPDDLLDFVNPSSQVTDLGIPFPALADDRDLEIEACTTYILEPGKSHLRVDTEVFNNYTPATKPPDVPDPLPLVVGDWLNPAGELDTVARSVGSPSLLTPTANGVGPPVASSLGTLGFYGFDEAFGTDYAFTQVPLPAPDTALGSFVYISGVIIVLHSQNALLTLLGADPVRFRVPMGGSRSFTRYFGVGDGSGSHAFDLENEVRAVATGSVEGCVSVAGAPVAGAQVSVGAPLGTGLPASSAVSDKLATHFTTREGACPNFSGSLPAGSYLAAAGLDGHLYEGGAATAPLKPVAVAAGGVAVVDFDLPQSGRLRVHVTDQDGDGIPARVSVVGFDPSPELVVAGPALPGFGGGPLGLLNDVDDALPFGIVAVGYADAYGVTEFDLEPGVGRYHVYVSRGSEYSAWRTPAPLDVPAGVLTQLDAQISHVVDTPGFVSSDFHVHGIRSADSRVSDTHRVESYSAEGVENVIMTDHHVHTDLKPAIRRAGMQQFVTATIGEEITTFDYGHFNAYPLLLDPDSPSATRRHLFGPQLSGGSTDWALAAPPGMDFPVYGALNATPAEILGLATAGDLSVPGVTTVQINHIDSHFEPLRIDTSLVPPADGLGDVARAQRRLPSTGAVPNLFQHYPALELWNGDNRGDQAQFLQERIGIWFNHLSQGLRTTFIADTDSHRFTNLNSAGARTWTASPTNKAWRIDPADVAASVDAGRAVGGQGVYVQTRLLATDGSGDVAHLGWHGQTTMSDAGGNVELVIDVQSPAWAQWDRIEVYANAATFPNGSDYVFGAVPTLVLDEGDCDPTTTGDGDFDIEVAQDVHGVPGAQRWSAELTLPFAGLSEPTWFVVVVRGTDGQCEPMFPMYPSNLAGGANQDLADLVDGNLGEGGVMALGATNALYFEP
jgi:hypothetical protein